MIKPNQFIKVRWSSSNKRNYINRGYVFTKLGEYFYVKPEDLSQYSEEKIIVICDYCGKEYSVTYKNFLITSKRGNGKTCCKECSLEKAKETNLQKYGTAFFTSTNQFKEKSKDTIMSKYGVDNVSQVSWIQQKKKETNLRKYGVEWFTASEQFKQDCICKYGVDNPMKNEDCKTKAGETILSHGFIVVSKEEIKFVEKLKTIYGKENCFPSFKVARYFLDCLLKIEDYLIDIEYDGWYWHIQKINSDDKRNQYLLGKGYKILRFVSKGRIPTINQIRKGITKILSGEDLVIIYV